MDITNSINAVTKKWAGSTWRTIREVGQEDRRRVIHSFKVGISLTLVSLLYLMEPLFKDIGQNAIWAVITVVLVLEFTAGATLCKGLNRGLGTLLAGSLALLMEYIAQESGRVFQAVFIGAAVFAVGTTATYIRFIPCIKKNYDYGVVIFLATFNLISVSSYRVHNVLQIAHARFYTVAVGCGICLLMSLFIFPIWSGQDLHDSTISKLEGLAKSIQACVSEYFCNEETNAAEDKSSENPIYKGYKAVLDSKSTDETLAMHASWEPCHSSNCYRVPWQQYVKLGDVIRHFGYTVVALHGCLQTEIQGEHVSETERKVLKPTLSKISITSLEFSEALPFAAFASLLVEAVARLDLVIEEMEELGRVANFREFCEIDDHEVEISVDVCRKENGSTATLDNHLPTHVVDC
ncbi:hypothetical protein OROGR_013663 [Orobanche gracilis]